MRLCLVAFAAIMTAACQSTGPRQTMSVQEARQISANFERTAFVAPPRNTEDLRELLGELDEVPDDCQAKIAYRKEELEERLKVAQAATPGRQLLAVARGIGSFVETLMSIGRFDYATDVLQRLVAAHDDQSYGQITRAGLNARLLRYHARLGQLDAAANYRAEYERIWGFSGLQSYKRPITPGDRFKRDGIGTIGWHSQTHSVKAELAFARGEVAVAEPHFRAAIKAAEEHSQYVSPIEMRAGLIRSLTLQGKLAEAEAEARQGITASSADTTLGLGNLADGASVAPIYAGLAEVYLQQRRSDDAAFVVRAAINMYESECAAPESLGLTSARKILIEVLAQQGRWGELLKEIEKARRALRHHPEIFASTFRLLLARVEAEIETGDLAQAVKLLAEARLLAVNRNGETSYQVAEVDALAAIAANNAGQRALPALASAVTKLLGADIPPSTGSHSRRSRLVDTYLAGLRQGLETGQRHFAGLDAVEEMFRVAAFLHETKVGRAMAASYLRASVKDPELALLIRQEQDLAEEIGALEDVVAYVASAPKEAGKFITPDELRTRLATLNSARSILRAEVLTRFPEFSDLTTPRPMQVDDVRARIKPGQALVMFNVRPDVTYVWAIPHTGPVAFNAAPIGERELSLRVRRLRAAVDPGDLQTLGDIRPYDLKSAHELYKVLLAPVKTGWAGTNELLVVSDGVLGALPLSMLVTQPAPPDHDSDLLFSRYRQAAWLLRDVSVTYLPAVGSLKHMAIGPRLRKDTRRPFVGFGDPFFNRTQANEPVSLPSEDATDRRIALRAAPATRAFRSAGIGDLPRLPDTAEEVIAVAGSLGANRARDVYLHERASETNVKEVDLSGYDVILFATHGLVPGDLNGLYEPALALSSPEVTGERDSDGLMVMHEVLGLNLDADFAVLSACNTAAADGQGAEAVSGLGRAFFYAGARALLVSNWPVHSAATTDLMTRTFSSLASENGLSRSAALRRTQLEQIDRGGREANGKLAFSYAHPIFWAPFTLVGDGGI
ncbi:MAG: CHAT domain-containing protein/tetratricopeptide (TPR) repeat protein [Rhodothermales bacterium]|jgi:CHAT domain-containing protein/tetratricopeptide (TPR) repeat protein